MPEKGSERERERDVAVNRRAFHDYFVDEKFEGGMVLTGTEVKSLRDGNAQLAASNGQTRKEVSVAASPAAMEEAARRAGFARPSEQVYVIVKPTGSAGAAAVGESAVPSLAGAATRQAATKHGGGVIDAIEKWWRNLWH